MRERELKRCDICRNGCRRLSLPMRERELKHDYAAVESLYLYVAPHAGARIETAHQHGYFWHG